jgi:hypothetical protein
VGEKVLGKEAKPWKKPESGELRRYRRCDLSAVSGVVTTHVSVLGRLMGTSFMCQCRISLSLSSPLLGHGLVQASYKELRPFAFDGGNLSTGSGLKRSMTLLVSSHSLFLGLFVKYRCIGALSFWSESIHPSGRNLKIIFPDST